MKNGILLSACSMALCLSLLASCDSKKPLGAKAHYNDDDVALNVKAPLNIKESKYEKENKYCKVEVDAEYPDGDDITSSSIRNTLVKYLYNAVITDEDNKIIKPYNATPLRFADAVDFYGKKLFDAIHDRSSADHDFRVKTTKEMAQENGESYDAPDVMQYYYDIEIEREWEAENYCVFDVEVDAFLGGAHGSSTNLGGLTFNKKDGKLFTNFLKPSSEKALQPLLRKGLIAYFLKEGDMHVDDSSLNELLQIEGNIIPLPKENPYPTEKGFVFRYGQYEIAPYAAGKPKVCVPYDKIKPFLTDEAIALLGI